MLTPLQIVDKVRYAKEKYNDKIVGGRSFKIPSWERADYDAACWLAISEGYDAKVTVTREIGAIVRGVPYFAGGGLRLHIKTK